MVSFDPYLNWLGIPPHEQPPNFYRLLGVVLFESNPEVIGQAADRQSLRVGAYQSGPQGEMCQQLLSEIAMAQFCLLDPQQKAAYDGQLQESLAQRGERAVAAPPPPGSPAGARQFSPPPPQFGPQAPQFNPQTAGLIHPGNGMQGPATMPGPPPPMQAPMPGMTAMPGLPSMAPPHLPADQNRPIAHGARPMAENMPANVMPMPPRMMSAPPGFASSMPPPSAPAALPMAVPFPAPTAAAVAAGPSAIQAPPPMPPMAPQRPIDELESLTAQPTGRRRIFKKRKKEDHSREIIIGSVVTAVGILLLIVYFAVTSNGNSKHGFGAIGDAVEKPPEKIAVKLAEERKRKEKEIAKAKEKEKEEKQAAAAHASASAKSSPLRSSGAAERRLLRPSSAADDGDIQIKVRNFGPPSRAMDSPDAGGPAGSTPQAGGHDTPQDLGGDNDPVFDTRKDTKDP